MALGLAKLGILARRETAELSSLVGRCILSRRRWKNGLNDYKIV